MKNLDTVYTDASCYESLLRFPTDVKLLWECVERAYKMMCSISSQLGEIRRQIRVHPDEGLLIFFDIHTANVVNLARRESVQVSLAA